MRKAHVPGIALLRSAQQGVGQDPSQQNRLLNQIVNHALALAGTTDYETNTPGWRVARQFYMIASPMTQCYSFLGATHMPFVPIYVDITEVIDKKVKALNCMISQQYGGRYALRRTEVNEGTYGHHNRTGYDLLPVSDRHLAWANEQEICTRERGSAWTVPFMYES